MARNKGCCIPIMQAVKSALTSISELLDWGMEMESSWWCDNGGRGISFSRFAARGASSPLPAVCSMRCLDISKESRRYGVEVRAPLSGGRVVACTVYTCNFSDGDNMCQRPRAVPCDAPPWIPRGRASKYVRSALVHR